MKQRYLALVVLLGAVLLFGGWQQASPFVISFIAGVQGVPSTTPQNATTPIFYAPLNGYAIAKQSTANLYGYYLRNDGAQECFLQFYDLGSSSTWPPTGVAPQFALPLGPGESANLFSGNLAMSHFQNGITVAPMTTPSGANPCSLYVTLWIE